MTDWNLKHLTVEHPPPRRREHHRSCNCDCFWRGMAAGVRLERAQARLRPPGLLARLALWWRGR